MAKSKSTALSPEPLPKNIERLLARLSELWTEKRPGFEKRLRPGASAATIARRSQELGLELPPAFYAFYAWHDGATDPQLDHLEDVHGWLSLRQVVMHKEMVDADKDPDLKVWHRAWVPFLHYDQTTVCIDTRSGVVFRWYYTDDKVELLAPSFLAWLTAHVALTQAMPRLAGASREHDSDRLSEAFTGEAAQRIRRKLSPGYPKTVDAVAFAGA